MPTAARDDTVGIQARSKTIKVGHKRQGGSRVALKVKATASANPAAIRREDVLRRLASLHSMDVGELKAQWRKLFDREPPPYNRRFLESRLAYRIQELAYGGLSTETVKRLEALGEQLDGGNIGVRRRSVSMNKPVAGTRLVREWQGEEYHVLVTREGFEWRGRPFKSLSSIAHAITGTKWNGLVFFGLKNQWRALTANKVQSRALGNEKQPVPAPGPRSEKSQRGARRP